MDARASALPETSRHDAAVTTIQALNEYSGLSHELREAAVGVRQTGRANRAGAHAVAHLHDLIARNRHPVGSCCRPLDVGPQFLKYSLIRGVLRRGCCRVAPRERVARELSRWQ